ncbi:uncharacterized protein TNCV_3394461 [Trichonephila clavipes]|nr:uncharacterized protein TNCV_3394461 [Trichonephila clavipes]
MTLTTVPLGLDSNPGEDMNVCKCVVPSRHGGTLNSRRATSPLVRLEEGEERWTGNTPSGACDRSSRLVWVSDRGLPCHEFEPSTTKDPPCRAVMHVKSVES